MSGQLREALAQPWNPVSRTCFLTDAHFALSVTPYRMKELQKPAAVRLR